MPGRSRKHVSTRPLYSEKTFQVVDPKLRKKHLRHLESSGIDVKGAQLSGQLELWDWYEAYLSDGHFDKDRMHVFIRDLRRGNDTLRLSGVAK
jgi:hypothetical protein